MIIRHVRESDDREFGPALRRLASEFEANGIEITHVSHSAAIGVNSNGGNRYTIYSAVIVGSEPRERTAAEPRVHSESVPLGR